MTTLNPETRLPADLLARASLAGKEYAWHPDDIPAVIEAARAANLVNIGGQLQFRFPWGGTCECYWVEVNTGVSAGNNALSWRDRVELSAEGALRDFAKLRAEVDFLAAGMEGFGKHLDAFRAEGGDPADAMCFVWYIEGQV
jgi:hypothetical protein